MNEEIIEPIGFMIEGENIVVANPCTIPIKLLRDALKPKRKKNEVTACFCLKIPLSYFKGVDGRKIQGQEVKVEKKK